MQESYPNPNVQGNPYIYLAVYSSVPVYEMMVRGIGVMRRREDSWLNATQILKVAGVDKGKRTKFLEKDIAQGVHEKIQGGYGRYQGTWIPFERAVELANAFNVAHLLAPLFDYTPPPPPVSLNGAAPPPPIVNPYAPASSQLPTPLPAPSSVQHTPQSLPQYAQVLPLQSAQDVLMQARQQGLIPEASPIGSPGPSTSSQAQPLPQPHSSLKRTSDVFDTEDNKRFRTEYTNGFQTQTAVLQAAERDLQQDRPALPSSVPAVSATNFRTTLQKSNKNSIELANIDPILLENNRTLLKSVFSLENESSLDPSTAIVPDLAHHLPPDVSSDLPIDESYHTALHWAAALGRLSVVQAFLNHGADLHLGNNVGETPLIRAILVTNNSDQDSFGRLLDSLNPSLRTVDNSGRSVLHHCALVAGVKGRATSARYYLETILVHIAKNEKGQFGDLINAQDSHGDTALNIAARVGNKALVRMLLDVGADKYKPNKLGLRPTDFGVDDPDLASNPAEETLHNLTSTSSVPQETSSEILESINEMVGSLAGTFDAELAARTELLTSKKAQLQALTSDLAASRSHLTQVRQRTERVEEKRLRIRNLERALEEEDTFDWTGRTEIDGTPASQLAGPGFMYRGPGSTLTNLPAGISIEFDTDPPAPTSDDGTSLVHLLRLQSWYERVESLLGQRIKRLEGGSAALERKLQRILADCCGVGVDEVDAMLDGLVRSLEADPSAQDLPKLAAFLSRVRDSSLK
ncbi:uncharacterized protein JCM15063_005216 [Sporobolomyces koalae]|uniref:uncharacterized protein n=1 Tax=Sporobolomyces koalae TaxID=500713 RepID=UPI003181049B